MKDTKLVLVAVFVLGVISFVSVNAVYANTPSETGVDKWLAKLVDYKHAGEISELEHKNALEYMYHKHLMTGDKSINSRSNVTTNSHAEKNVLDVTKSVAKIFNSAMLECTVYSDGTSADIVGNIQNRDISPHTIIITTQVLDSHNNVLKSVNSDMHEVRSLGEWHIENTISGTMKIDHCGLSVRVLK